MKLSDIFNEWKEVFSKFEYPTWIDQSKIKRETKQENGGITITESYSDGYNYWQSSSWNLEAYNNKTKITRPFLEKQLKKAINNENYEMATILRDKLKCLTKQ